MYWTLDRLLLIAVVITLISVDGVYRAWKQREADTIGPTQFLVYTGILIAGSSLTWIGFLVEWIET